MEELSIEKESTALDSGGVINYKKFTKAGLFYNKFFQGIIGDFVFGKVFSYTFFQLYLNLDGNQYNNAMATIQTLWALKFVWGIASDAIPIFKKRRIPYMVLGWVGAFIALGICIAMGVPEPYYKVEGCYRNMSIISNPANVATAIPYIYAIAFTTSMLAVCDVASDALVIEYNRREPVEIRGQANAWAAIFIALGRVLVIILVAIALNGPSFNGIFCFELPIPYYFAIMAFFSFCGILTALFSTVEHSKVKRVSFKNLTEYLKGFWRAISEKQLLCFAVYMFLHFFLLEVKSSASVKIKSKWAKVGPLANTITSLIAKSIYVIAMYIYKKYLINANWRKINYAMNIFIVFFSLCIDTITIFDIYRSPYFYCIEPIVNYFPLAMIELIGLQVCAEVSSNKYEAITFGLFMASWSAANPNALVFGNFITSFFDVSTDFRYLRDSTEDRLYVFSSVFICKMINLLSIAVTILLMPTQKIELQKRIQLQVELPRARTLLFILFLMCLAYVIVSNILTMIPSTSCYQLFGGSGCY